MEKEVQKVLFCVFVFFFFNYFQLRNWPNPIGIASQILSQMKYDSSTIPQHRISISNRTQKYESISVTSIGSPQFQPPMTKPSEFQLELSQTTTTASCRISNVFLIRARRAWVALIHTARTKKEYDCQLKNGGKGKIEICIVSTLIFCLDNKNININ